jgi:WD40 repeat protein
VWDEESGELRRELKLEGFGGSAVSDMAISTSADGQQPRLVLASYRGKVRVYDPEAGSLLHHLDGHDDRIRSLACIASSSAAPHHPRLVSGSDDAKIQVWDGETGERLASLEGFWSGVASVAVWKEHTGGHDRIATAEHRRLKIWDGETFELLHDLECTSHRLLAFKSAEGPHRLLVAGEFEAGLQVWDPEEGRLLHHAINSDYSVRDWQLFESAEGRQLLAIVGSGDHHARHPGETWRIFLDVWDLGEAPSRVDHLRPAHHLA